MHEDDAKFEADIALAVASMGSCTVPEADPVVLLYASLWCAAIAASCLEDGAKLYCTASNETAANFHWPK